MTSKYAAYPVYGEDKGRLVLGSSKELDNKNVIFTAMLLKRRLQNATLITLL